MTEFLQNLGSGGALALRIVLIVAVTLAARAVSGRILARVQQRVRDTRPEHAGSVSALRHTLGALIYFLGGMTIMNQIPGLEKLASSLLAGSGIAALAISMAAQSALGDLVGGVILSIFKPFRIGDVVRYLDKDITGTVEEITLRHTVIRTVQNRRVIVPNGVMNSQAVENATYGDSRARLLLDLEITYESDLEYALSLLADTVRAHPSFTDARTPQEIRAGEPPVVTRVVDFLASGIQIRALIWTPSAAAGIAAKSDLLRAVKKAFDANGVDFAYPHQEVILRRADR